MAMTDSCSEERKRILAVSLPFDAKETPVWRRKEEVSVQKMITEIMQYRKVWEKEKDSYARQLVERVSDSVYIPCEHGRRKWLFHL